MPFVEFATLPAGRKDLYLKSNNNRKLLMVIDFFLDQETGQPWMAKTLIVLGKEKENAGIYRKQLSGSKAYWKFVF